MYNIYDHGEYRCSTENVSEVEIRSPSAELMYRVFAELRNGPDLQNRGDFATGPVTKRYSSMSNIAVQTASTTRT